MSRVTQVLPGPCWAVESLLAKQFSFQRSDASSTTSYVLTRLRDDILSAHFSPGSKLPMKELMARYSASVVPIREALAVLCGAGLIVAESQRGFFVAAASREELVDIAEMRTTLEGLALQRSVARRDVAWAEQVCRVGAAFARVAQKAGQEGPISDQWESLHREFHFALISRCGSPTLLEFCAQLHDRYDRYRRLVLPAGSYMAGVAGDHEEISAAALAGDDQLAMNLIRTHIDSMTQVLLDEYTRGEAT